jgi:hypothetical protein
MKLHRLQTVAAAAAVVLRMLTQLRDTVGCALCEQKQRKKGLYFCERVQLGASASEKMERVV